MHFADRYKAPAGVAVMGEAAQAVHRGMEKRGIRRRQTDAGE
jgi:hypothetical protein